MAPEALKERRYDIEPFDPEKHDRTAFFSGVERIDNFLKKSARKHQAGDFSRVFVAVEIGGVAVAGFYSLNAHVLAGCDLPDALTKRGPPHGVPAVYLSMLGVNRPAQGAGLGVILLGDALKRVLAASESVGVKAVILDVIDDDGAAAYDRRKRFYERMGFASFSDRPSRMFLTVKDIGAAFR